MLVSGGRLAGILDAGGLGPADPALDLVAAWHLLEAGPRQALRDDLRCDDLEWERGKAWAFEQAMGLVWYYAGSNPAMSRLGRRTLDRIQADLLSAHAGDSTHTRSLAFPRESRSAWLFRSVCRWRWHPGRKVLRAVGRVASGARCRVRDVAVARQPRR